MSAVVVMACAKSTRKNPEGRTGTTAGYQAHRDGHQAPCSNFRDDPDVLASALAYLLSHGKGAS